MKYQTLQNISTDKKHTLFECNICTQNASNPVITKCGHLFCWICIYNWYQKYQENPTCPNCKSIIHFDQIIPIFTKHNQQQNSLHQQQRSRQGIPPRPRPKRQNQIPNPAAIGSGLPNPVNTLGMNLQRGVLLAGYGLFPSVGILAFNCTTQIDDSGQAQPSPELKYQLLFKIILLLLIMFLVFILIKF